MQSEQCDDGVGNSSVVLQASLLPTQSFYSDWGKLCPGLQHHP